MNFMETIEKHYTQLAQMLIDFADYTPEQADAWRDTALAELRALASKAIEEAVVLAVEDAEQRAYDNAWDVEEWR